MKKLKDKIILMLALNMKKIKILLLIVLLVIPFITKNRYHLGIAIMFFIYSMLSMSVNLITGFVGITSLGQAAFFGIGAYTSAILGTRLGIGFIPGAILAVLLSAIFGAALGLPTLRIKGRYLAIVTLGFSEIIRMVELNWMSLTRGPQGISNIPGIKILGKNFNSNTIKYYVGVILLIGTIYFVNSILNSKDGRAAKSIKDDELASEAMGINTYYYKVTMFAISAGIAGLAGCYYSHYMSFIDPNAFNFDQSILILSMAILGGLGSIPGSILGAFILTLLPEVLRFLVDYRQIIYGTILVIVVIFRPSGLIGNIDFSNVREKYNLRIEEEASGRDS